MEGKHDVEAYCTFMPRGMSRVEQSIYDSWGAAHRKTEYGDEDAKRHLSNAVYDLGVAFNVAGDRITASEKSTLSESKTWLSTLDPDKLRDDVNSEMVRQLGHTLLSIGIRSACRCIQEK